MKRALLAVSLAACSKTAAPPPPPPPAPAAAPAHHEDRRDPAEAAPPLHLDVVAGDGTHAAWNQDLFDRVPHFESTNHGGESRDTWSLRELARAAAGPNVRVAAVIGDVTKPIDAAAWTDPTRTPIVHRTRRGALKFRWADAAGRWGETEVKDVTRLELARSAH
ncbi:MAG TPA: hypothetical protein VGF94_27235 [Kofleriaceae bacterium]